MKILLYVILALGLLKIAWNLVTPYVLAFRAWKSDAAKTRAISMATIVELVLLLAGWLCSYMMPGQERFVTPSQIIIWGSVSIVFSYVHLVVAGFIISWAISSLKKKFKARREGEK